MKIVYSFLLLGMVALAFSGCSGGSKSSEDFTVSGQTIKVEVRKK